MISPLSDLAVVKEFVVDTPQPHGDAKPRSNAARLGIELLLSFLLGGIVWGVSVATRWDQSKELFDNSPVVPWILFGLAGTIVGSRSRYIVLTIVATMAGAVTMGNIVGAGGPEPVGPAILPLFIGIPVFFGLPFFLAAIFFYAANKTTRLIS